RRRTGSGANRCSRLRHRACMPGMRRGGGVELVRAFSVGTASMMEWGCSTLRACSTAVKRLGKLLLEHVKLRACAQFTCRAVSDGSSGHQDDAVARLMKVCRRMRG